jgi:hypothetical protein
MVDSPWDSSPQQIDPMSWFTRPRIPVVFSLLLLFYGSVTLTLWWDSLWQPWLEIVALACASSAGLVIVLSTRPMRSVNCTTISFTPMFLLLSATVLSTINGVHSSVPVQHWWVPVGVGFVIGTISPFVSLKTTLVNGAIITVVVAFGAVVGFMSPERVWPAASTVLIAINATASATAAAAAIVWMLITTTQKVRAQQREARANMGEIDAEIALRVERRTLARLGTRVAPFLEGIADSGVVTAEDRAIAGHMARRLRTDLIGQANRSWLESVALYGPLYVVDPDHRADQMTSIQRMALRGLLEQIMRDPMTHEGRLLIELRGREDGSTAVGVTVDVDLPEGRRIAMIAPYYLTLQTAVDDLRWDSTKESLNYTMPTPREPGGAS